MDASRGVEGCTGCRRHRSALLGILGHDGMRRTLVWLPVGLVGAFALGLSLWTCPLVQATGCRCPGCGLTRAAEALGRGDVAGSLAWHPFALGLALGWALLVVYELLGRRRRAPLHAALAGVERRLPLSSVFVGAFLIFGVGRLLGDAATAAGWF